jgi:hypothetical protein
LEGVGFMRRTRILKRHSLVALSRWLKHDQADKKKRSYIYSDLSSDPTQSARARLVLPAVAHPAGGLPDPILGLS